MPKLHTHGSIFHADEVIGAALFVHLGDIATSDILRANHAPESPAPGDIVLDIGGRHGVDDNGVVWLDHHQDKDMPCAAVLTFRHLEPRLSPATKKAAERFLDGVDRHDRGMEPYIKGRMTLSDIIAALNPVGEATEDKRTANFREAVTLFVALFNRMVAYQELVESQAGDVARLAALNAPFVVAEQYLPKLLRTLEGTLTRHAVYPSLRGGWSVQAVCIPNTKTPVQPVPAGIAGATFVHATGFIASFATKEEAVAAATELAKIDIVVPAKAVPEEVIIPLPGTKNSTAVNPFGV